MATPSQTVGPFYGYALPFTGGGDLVPPGEPGAVVLHGRVYDGAGAAVPDALLEFWQPGPDGGAPGSLRRDPVTGRIAGRDGVTRTGFGRVATDADGHYTVRALRTPYIAVAVFARGLTHHLYTRAYLGTGTDALLTALAPERRATLLAGEERPGMHRFDIRLQGGGGREETVFLDFRDPD